MTRDFYLTWGDKFNNVCLHIDPVKCEDWNIPIEMARWVVGHAMFGKGQRWQETRRTDEVTVMGVAGRWEGMLYSSPFIILDTLFAEKPVRAKQEKVSWTEYVARDGQLVGYNPAPGQGLAGQAADAAFRHRMWAEEVHAAFHVQPGGVAPAQPAEAAQYVYRDMYGQPVDARGLRVRPLDAQDQPLGPVDPAPLPEPVDDEF